MAVREIRQTMTNKLDHAALNAFIVKAKAATYVGDGAPGASSRPASHDLSFQDGEWSYLDSYFGGSDFIGQEAVYCKGQPVWAMNYYGRLLHPEQITAAEAGQTIKASLSAMYKAGRFLGGFQHTVGNRTYTDTSTGDVTCFTGQEWITQNGLRVYELVYHGGLIKD